MESEGKLFIRLEEWQKEREIREGFAEAQR